MPWTDLVLNIAVIGVQIGVVHKGTLTPFTLSGAPVPVAEGMLQAVVLQSLPTLKPRLLPLTVEQLEVCWTCFWGSDSKALKKRVSKRWMWDPSHMVGHHNDRSSSYCTAISSAAELGLYAGDVASRSWGGCADKTRAARVGITWASCDYQQRWLECLEIGNQHRGKLSGRKT